MWVYHSSIGPLYIVPTGDGLFGFLYIDGILRRGVMNTRVENMIRVCQFLGISLDALVSGRIEPYSDRPSFSIDDVSALEKYHNLPASDKETVDFVLNRHAQRAESAETTKV